jgi:NhaP-type Na+/H+ and K+/H+ antiporter
MPNPWSVVRYNKKVIAFNSVVSVVGAPSVAPSVSPIAASKSNGTFFFFFFFFVTEGSNGF